MVTLATLIINVLLFIMIITIDTILYKVSFFTSIYLLFTIHMSMGKIYLFLATIFMIASAIFIDIRRIRGPLFRKEE
ncbi:hypothetical protein DS745_13230 [Anaerobacillus alkaliphilus]|uniref:Uncharacterized protein n=1 Tax=Anaerobacillus alkaliphilus TaxID=1548597 RepID=A0A4Q0VRG3_9BACI|nr:hypothetical protein [Anaerobacillus alkaliphilus]RXI99840.1 hypothetical protein DS745_13230 [Anaerobacillus alkaliphilus]